MKYLKIFSFLFIIAAVQSCLSADEDPVQVPKMTGSEVSADVGGPTEANQVWIDLSDAKNHTINKRTDWDLGFYTGDEYRVILNGSIAMAVAKIPNATNINTVKESDVADLKEKVQVGTFDAANMKYVDNPDGNFLNQSSAIEPIKENDADNPVYLVNLGRNLADPNSNIAAGSVSLSSDPRGWKKIQILRAPNGYKLRYADINATTYQEYMITKDTEYNFNFFNLKTGAPATIQPKKKNWDLAFTTFTNEVFMGPGNSAGSYFYADFIITNTASGVGAYQVTASGNLDQAYNSFKLSNVDQAKLVSTDQRAIGDKWRTTTGTSEVPGAFVYADRFFVLKDAEGFYFKLRFNKMKDPQGNRGHASFEFEPL
ncbi:HmuY family protein [Chryseobacterium daecheongense]|nr:HmuY family protein [Chryseobacterium daecheongense]